MKLLLSLHAALFGFALVKPLTAQNVSETSSLRKQSPQRARQLLLFDLFKYWPSIPTQPLYSPVQPIFYSPPAPVPAPAPALKCASLPTGQFYNLIAKHSNMAVNVEGASLNNGAPLLQWPVLQAKNNNWRFESVGSGYYQIIAEHSGKAINGKTLRRCLLDLITIQ